MRSPFLAVIALLCAACSDPVAPSREPVCLSWGWRELPKGDSLPPMVIVYCEAWGAHQT